MGPGWALLRVGACWGGRHEKTYFDVRGFNPHAPSNVGTNPYKKHERIRRMLMNSVSETWSMPCTFTPIVLAAGGMAKEAETFYKRLSSLLAAKWDNHQAL